MTTVRPTLLVTELPIALRPISVYEPLLKALERPILGKWPEGTAYHEADQPTALGRILVAELHEHLVNVAIGYLFREKMANNDRVRLATASKVGSRLAYFSELDFLIEVNWEAWKDLTAFQRVALIDHELCHCGTEETDAGTKCVMLSHDVEEFGSIVHRWGLWKPDLMQFGKVMQHQLALFPQPDPAGLKDLADREADDAEHEQGNGNGNGEAGPRRGRPKGSK